MTTTFNIQSLVDDTYLLTFEPDLADLLKTGESNCSKIIAIAFEELKLALQARGKMNDQIPQSESTKYKIIHAYKTLEMLYRRAIKEQGDRFHVLGEEYKQKFLTAIDQVVAAYDYDESGEISDEEEELGNRFTLQR